MKKFVLGIERRRIGGHGRVCGRRTTTTTQVAARGGDDTRQRFTKLDADKDGRVSAIEAANDSKLAAAFTQADTDKDGYLSMGVQEA